MLKQFREIGQSYKDLLNQRTQEIYEEFSGMEGGLYELSVIAAQLELLREYDAEEHERKMDEYGERVADIIRNLDKR